MILLGPAQGRAGLPAWQLPETALLHGVWGGGSYLFAALVYSLLAGMKTDASRSARLAYAALALIAGFAPPLILLTVVPDLSFSRGLFLTSAVLGGISLGTLAMLREAPRLLVALPAAGVVLLVAQGRELEASDGFGVETQFYALRVESQRPVPLDADTLVEGGGLARLDDGLLLVTGAGRFALLTRDSADTGWRTRPLDLASPANAARFASDAPPGTATHLFRVVDLLAERRSDSVAITVTHHHWDATARCFTLRVSEVVGNGSLTAWGDWKTRLDARPCLTIRDSARGLPFNGAAAGGRLLRLDGRGILITVGDHQSDGLNAPEILPQDTTSDYGHTVLLSDDGTVKSFTLGHRNPQGLARDAQGRIWSTEHGPRGGDELNLLIEGENYGWPWRTHGVEYALRQWPSQRPASDAWREPAFALVPSQGISNLLAVRSQRFPAWSGDLLVGTLKERQLLRLRLDGDRVAYVEAIRLGYELRDLEETADGSLVAWTDQGVLLTLRPDDRDDSGAALAAQCAGCHTLNQGQLGALGPNLNGIVGRAVASMPGYAYSPALKALGGKWTEQRLDDFLADPATYAPGNRMGFAGIPDSAARRALIDYLRVSSRW